MGQNAKGSQAQASSFPRLTRRGYMSTLTAACSGGWLAAGAAAVAQNNSANDPAVSEDREATDNQILGNALARFARWPEIAMRDQCGNSVDLYRDVLANRLIVLNFFYSRCDGSCPTTLGTMSALAKLQMQLERPTRFVSITLDPGHDTPQVLATCHAGLVPAGADWHFLCASLETTNDLRRYLGFVDLDEPPGQVLRRHAAMVLIGSDVTHHWLTLPATASLRQWRSSLFRCAPRIS